MVVFFQKFLNWTKNLFWKEELELTSVGLQFSGKTTFINVWANGKFNENMFPTVGFNMRRITKGNVSIKVWDIGGQARFRSMWERYCRGVNAIIFMVDSADPDRLESAAQELRNLLRNSQLVGIPLLVLGNKSDLPQALPESDLIKSLNMSDIRDRPTALYSISCLENYNIKNPLNNDEGTKRECEPALFRATIKDCKRGLVARATDQNSAETKQLY